MDLGLTGKHAIVTGGSKGIGFAVAQALRHEGAKVGLIARDLATLERAQAALGGPEHVAIAAADLTDPVQAEQAVAALEQRLGDVQILVNSAGAARRRAPEELDSAAWHAALSAKFHTYMHAQDAVLRRLLARAQAQGIGADDAPPAAEVGAIVNIIGLGGRVPNPTHVAGGAANAALLLSTIGLAQHYARYGIRLNAVNPGDTMTERLDQAVAVEAVRLGQTPEQVVTALAQAMPLRRFGRPEEVANVVLFLASERASYVVGAHLAVDGGRNPTI